MTAKMFEKDDSEKVFVDIMDEILTVTMMYYTRCLTRSYSFLDANKLSCEVHKDCEADSHLS